MNEIILHFKEIIFQNTAAIILTSGIIFGFVLLGLFVHTAVYLVLRYLGQHRTSRIYSSIVHHTRSAARWFVIFLSLSFALPLVLLQFPEWKTTTGLAYSILNPFIIISLAWLLIKLISVLEDIVSFHYHLDQGDLKNRRINTQFQLLKRILIIVIVVFATGSILMTFDRIRQLGAAILASAGIIGIIVGVAAQRSVANLLAGIQIALTEPIRLGDSVTVEGEFGIVEEITLTYVVVKVWDNRRMVLPIVYFIEKPFQNWTREPTNLLGTILFYVDYTVPVNEVREEFLRLLREAPKWDGASSGFQVTNLNQNTVELRATVSAVNSGDLWDLRCELREKLILFLRERYPESLPKFRAEIRGPVSGNPGEKPGGTI